MELKATRIFYENYNSTAPIVVNRGGSRSSKSYSIMQLLMTRFLTERQKSFLIVRKTSPAMRVSTLKLFYDLCRGEFGMNPDTEFRPEKQLLNYYYGNNYLHFGSIDDPEKIKSTEWNYIWMEEANEFELLDYRALGLRISAPSKDGRMNQMFLSFNPIDIYHWLKTELIDVDDSVQEIVSTYRDNPFLDESYVKKLLRIEKQDPNFFRIYVLGEWGKLENLIYTEKRNALDDGNWRVGSEAEWPEEFDDRFAGLDFGFTNAPTALLFCGVDAENPNRVWEKEIVYATGMTNQDLIEYLRETLSSPECPLRMEDPIYADSAEPARIEDLRREGFNIVDVQKKSGSVLAGIGDVKKREVIVHPQSPSLIKEKRSYSWRQDRAKRSIDIPIKANDHLMDGERMCVTEHLGGSNPDLWLL